METNISKYDQYVIKGILLNNQHGITEVINLESVVIGFFYQEEYAGMETLIRKGDIAALKNRLSDQDKTSEYLDVMTFTDQNGHKYIATVYDNDELWQDPQVIDYFAL